MAPKLYVYKLTHDANAAPCVEGGLLTLAICKPMIRAAARKGDLLFGFAASSLRRDNRLVYIARVTGVEVDGDYYENETYEGRADRIYIRGDDGHFRVRSDARFHECGTLVERDVGVFPEYEKARVLVSEDFRYFGTSKEPPSLDLGPYTRVRTLVQRLGQGHGVNHPPDVARELLQLHRDVWGDHPTRVLGEPSTSEACRPSRRPAAWAGAPKQSRSARGAAATPITREGLVSLQGEIEELEGPRRRELAARIRAARELGDLKENAEYHIAKDDQAHLETRISRLRERLSGAAVTETGSDRERFSFGRTAEVVDEHTGDTHRWTLVGSTEADLSRGRLSVESPVGSALRDRGVGETVAIKAPRGERRFRISRLAE